MSMTTTTSATCLEFSQRDPRAWRPPHTEMAEEISADLAACTRRANATNVTIGVPVVIKRLEAVPRLHRRQCHNVMHYHNRLDYAH